MIFNPITLSDKPVFDKYLARFPQYHSDASFVTTFAWNDMEPCKYTEVSDHLIFTHTLGEDTDIHAPIGVFDPKLFDTVFDYARENNYSLTFLDPTYLDYMARAHPDIQIRNNRDYAEYYYRPEILANLNGRAYLNIRKHINRFTARYKYTVEPVSRENMTDINSMLDTWSAQNITPADSYKRDEFHALKNTLPLMSELGCEGICIRLGDEIIALAIWEILPNKVALIHYEKCLKAYNGSYKIINLETARALQNRADWINRESDLNLPGLRESKMRYHPDHMCQFWYANP